MVQNNYQEIWVGKFETTGSAETPTVLPNEASLMNQIVSEQFTTAQKFNTYVNNSNIDAHMAKNSEWGAVAYLSQSKYGKYGNVSYIGENKEVYQNKSISCITGNSNGTPGTSTTNTQCEYNDITDRGSGTGACGAGASTTGNITGVYDMSGGAYEYVMGVYNNTIKSSGFSTLPNSKYYDNYTSTKAVSACNNEICYGHALSETSEWYNDSTEFPSSASPWFMRGGGYGYNSNAGVFGFHHLTGDTMYLSTVSFRIVLVGI